MTRTKGIPRINRVYYRVLQLLREGKERREIAEEMGYNDKYVYLITQDLKRKGIIQKALYQIIQPNVFKWVFKDNPDAKFEVYNKKKKKILTEEQIKEIGKLYYKEGFSYTQISDFMGFPRTTVAKKVAEYYERYIRVRKDVQSK